MRLTRVPLQRLQQISRFRLISLLRMIALVTALQLSGAIHATVDLYSAFAGTVVATDCEDEREGKQCPAGCPNCHCAARTTVAPPRVINVEALLAVDDGERTSVRVSVLRSPQGPPQTSLYRPPRV